MDERRQHVRLSLELEFSYAQKPEPWGQIARTEDVCVGGLRGSMSKPLDLGAHYEIQLILPGRQSIPVTAEAVWSDQFLYTTIEKKSEFKVGLRFVRIKASDRERLKEYVSGSMN